VSVGAHAYPRETTEARLRDILRGTIRSMEPHVTMIAQTAGLGSPGVDVLICAGGYFVAVEVKRPGRKATARQRATLDKVKAAGGRSYLVSSAEDIEKLAHELSNLIRRRTKVEDIFLWNY